MLGNGLHGLGNGPYVLGNGLYLLGIMSQFGIMSHSVLCRIRGYVVRHHVFRDYVAFRVMSFGIMLHSALCRIWTYVVRLNVIRRNVVRPTVVYLCLQLSRLCTRMRHNIPSNASAAGGCFIFFTVSEKIKKCFKPIKQFEQKKYRHLWADT